MMVLLIEIDVSITSYSGIDGGHKAAADETKEDMWMNLLPLFVSLSHTHCTHTDPTHRKSIILFYTHTVFSIFE